MRRAMGDAGLNPEDVDYVNAHGTSTPMNDSNEAKAIVKVLGGAASSVSVSSTKSATGHMLGAAGSTDAGGMRWGFAAAGLIAVLGLAGSRLLPTRRPGERDRAGTRAEAAR